MSGATKEYVSERLVPLEGTIRNMQDNLETVATKLDSRSADWASMEKRIEEVALQVQ